MGSGSTEVPARPGWGQQRAGGGSWGACGRGHDGAMCCSLAGSGYRPALRAHCVDNLLIALYLAQDEPITGSMGVRDFTVDVKAGKVVVSLHRGSGGRKE